MLNNTKAYNVCLSAPGLAINGTGNATVKWANTFVFKANGRLSTSITTAAVSTATFVAATVVGVLPSGTATTAGVLATGYGRVYAVVGTMLATATTWLQAPSYSVVSGHDYLIGTERPLTLNFPEVNGANQCIIGWVCVENISGSNFTPGTTALDATGIKTTYIDNFGIVGN